MSVDLDEIRNTYSFYAQMSQSKEFLYIKQTFEIIKDIISDGTLIVNSSGIKINKMNSSGEALVHVKFDASRLTFYHCPEQLEIGLDFTALSKRLRQFPVCDSTAFHVKKNSLMFGISCYIAEKKKTLNYEMIMNETEKEEIKIPNSCFKSVLVINSNEFKTICSNALLIPYINIEYNNHQLIFHGKGSEGKFYCILDEIEQKDDNENTYGVTCNNNISYHGKFDTELLTKFSKAYIINDQMKMFLKNDNALVIQYEIGSFGCLRFCLGEKDDCEEDEVIQNTRKSWGPNSKKHI